MGIFMKIVWAPRVSPSICLYLPYAPTSPDVFSCPAASNLQHFNGILVTRGVMSKLLISHSSSSKIWSLATPPGPAIILLPQTKSPMWSASKRGPQINPMRFGWMSPLREAFSKSWVGLEASLWWSFNTQHLSPPQHLFQFITIVCLFVYFLHKGWELFESRNPCLFCVLPQFLAVILGVVVWGSEMELSFA